MLIYEINPALLPPRERGRPTEALIEAMSTVGLSSTTFTTGGPALEFGRPTAVTGIPGSECLIRVSAPNLIAYNDSASKSQLDATEKSSRRRRLSLDEFEAPDIKRARLEASSGVGKVTGNL
ncbi:unnamed protein product [Protopolystoma xenopodis]|uniref:Uncharacterized protein n=1 Tax=Protopolystoma xenopodis TaxID=117903 RepID=A0A3S5A209_9PLAT|nr:unnamed protein product [Protopolystoma xenopodis]